MHGSSVVTIIVCWLVVKWSKMLVKNPGLTRGVQLGSLQAGKWCRRLLHSPPSLAWSLWFSWIGGLFFLLDVSDLRLTNTLSQNLCEKKDFLKLTSKSEVEVGGVNTVAAPEVEGAWARVGHALIKLLEFQKQHSHINTTLYISHFQHIIVKKIKIELNM